MQNDANFVLNRRGKTDNLSFAILYCLNREHASNEVLHACAAFCAQTSQCMVYQCAPETFILRLPIDCDIFYACKAGVICMNRFGNFPRHILLLGIKAVLLVWTRN